MKYHLGLTVLGGGDLETSLALLITLFSGTTVVFLSLLLVVELSLFF